MKQQTLPLTGYQKLVIFILAVTLFTVVLDFMVMSPLGPMLMKSLKMSPANFSIAVSAYAFSAGAAGLLTAGFADKFDRKKLLLFFYTGFIGGTIFCGMAQSFEALVAARIITGLFGGVIGSIAMAIVADTFALEQRGRAMGLMQMGFGASQVLGLPIGLAIAKLWGWEAPFWMVAGLAIIIALLIVFKLKPVTEHLAIKNDKNAIMHLWHTFAKRDYRIGFLSTALLSIGGFMMMPFGTTFAVNNLGVKLEQLSILFMVSGCVSLVIMPVMGKLSDKIDKFTLFAIACVWLMIICVLYTNLGLTPFWLVIIFNVLMMMGVLSRMVPASTLTSAIPDMQDRGAFMSINSSLQQVAGGFAALIAGQIVVQKTPTSPLEHYNIVGYVMVVISAISIFLIYRVNSVVKKKMAHQHPVQHGDVVVDEPIA